MWEAILQDIRTDKQFLCQLQINQTGLLKHREIYLRPSDVFGNLWLLGAPVIVTQRGDDRIIVGYLVFILEAKIQLDEKCQL